jgi:hypothetical protein
MAGKEAVRLRTEMYCEGRKEGRTETGMDLDDEDKRSKTPLEQPSEKTMKQHLDLDDDDGRARTG